MFVTNCKDVSLLQILSPPWVFCITLFFSSGHISWKSRQVLIVSTIFGFMLPQYMGLHVSILVFPMPTWLRWSCFSGFIFVHVLLFFCHDGNSVYDCNLVSEWPMWPQSLLFLNLSMARYRVHVLIGCLHVHPLVLLFLFLLVTCHLVCPCMALLN